MKHKILITGKNNTIIDDFFDHMDEEFSMLTTSLRYKDMTEHMKIFEPDLFVYCLNNETADDVKRLMNLKRHLSKQNVDLVFIGDENDCEALTGMNILILSELWMRQRYGNLKRSSS